MADMRSHSTSSDSSSVEQTVSFTLPTDVWFYIENVVAWAPIGFLVLFSVLASNAMRHLFIRERPFIIEPFLPCGHLIILLVGFAVLLSKWIYHFVKNKSDGQRLVVTALILVFVTAPSFFLLVIMPALFEVLRHEALTGVIGN